MKIGLGTAQFGMKYGISNVEGQTSALEVSRILRAAAEVGIKVIDTAFAYGDAEVILGSNDLQSFKIVSKFLLSDTEETPESLLRQSLQRLQVAQLYGYLAHRSNDLLSKRKRWEELQILKSERLVSKIGYSLNAPVELETLLAAGMIPDLIQVPYNYFDTRFASYFQQLRALGCEIHTRSAFLQGLFFMEPDKLPAFFDPLKPTLRELSLAYKHDLDARLLNYVCSNKLIDCVIIGVENVTQLQSNLRLLGTGASLPDAATAMNEYLLMPMNWPQLSIR